MATQDEFIPLELNKPHIFGELSPIGSSVTDLSNTSSISTSFDCGSIKTEVGKGIQHRGFSTQYTRPLNPPAIAFSTKEGEAMFCEAIAGGTAFGSLKLLENFGMQRGMNFCGPATLCTVLNALRVDPKRPLIGRWRWFEDPMVGDSEIMGNIEEKGITFDKFVELASNHVDIEAFKAQHSSLEQFTDCVIQTTSTEELYMILSYSRKKVNQTGDGHFSPMAVYHKGKDMLLILDVARFKYPFHWLPRMTVWDAMNEIDKETGETRGFMMVRRKSFSTSVLSNESSPIPFLNGDNFSNLKDKILLTSGCMDLDLALHVDETSQPMVESSAAEKSAYNKWERSNHLSRMLIKSHISQSISDSIPQSDKVKNYTRAIEGQFVSSDKASANTLMKKILGMKHNNSRSVCEHIMEMRDIATCLKSLEIEISESFLVNLILNSLPVEYEAFQISYNTQKEKWSINELLIMCVQEEERLKHGKVQSTHQKVHMKKNCLKYKKCLKKKGLPQPKETDEK